VGYVSDFWVQTVVEKIGIHCWIDFHVFADASSRSTAKWISSLLKSSDLLVGDLRLLHMQRAVRAWSRRRVGAKAPEYMIRVPEPLASRLLKPPLLSPVRRVVDRIDLVNALRLEFLERAKVTISPPTHQTNGVASRSEVVFRLQPPARMAARILRLLFENLARGGRSRQVMQSPQKADRVEIASRFLENGACEIVVPEAVISSAMRRMSGTTSPSKGGKGGGERDKVLDSAFWTALLSIAYPKRPGQSKVMISRSTTGWWHPELSHKGEAPSGMGRRRA
jgi:hypothetical protein